MRDDKLAKLLFLVGCAGLPWLWAVHLMYFAGKRRRAALGQEEPSQSGLLDGETLIVDDEPGDPAEIELEAKKWVRREFFALVMVSLAWLTWIIVFQVLRDYFPAGWLVRGEDEAEVTGW
jgi:Presenilin enhancer-2 subunit of gamma secretase